MTIILIQELLYSLKESRHWVHPSGIKNDKHPKGLTLQVKLVFK